MRMTLRGGDVASVIVPQYGLDDQAFQKHAERLVPLIQEAGAAALIAGTLIGGVIIARYGMDEKVGQVAYETEQGTFLGMPNPSGPRTYSDHRGHPRLRMRHVPFKIGPIERDAWLLSLASGTLVLPGHEVVDHHLDQRQQRAQGRDSHRQEQDWAGLGAVLALHLSASSREPWWVRVPAVRLAG